MGITASQQRVFDKKQSTSKSMKEAVKLQEKNVAEPKTRTGKKAESEEGLLKKTKRRLKELWGGEKTYLKKGKKSKKSVRTKQVESGLKQAGLSDKDIAKFQKK